MGTPKDWTGQKFHMLTFIKPLGKDAKHGVIWELLCDCGKTIQKVGYVVVAGQRKSCGCLAAENKSMVKRYTGSCRKYHPRMSTARHVWTRGYKRKGDDIDFDTFYHLSQQPCEYCGTIGSNSYNVANSKSYRMTDYQLKEGEFTYNGLDRIDSNRGHTADNVVPCCWKCNRMKGNMPREDFIEHIRRMYQHTARQERW